MSYYEANILGCDTQDELAGLSVKLNRCYSADLAERLQISINPSSCSFVHLDRRGVQLLIKFLQNSLDVQSRENASQ